MSESLFVLADDSGTNFFVLLAAVPLVTGLIGWLTNWAAVKMIFSPREFVGIGPIGWQGIVPRQCVKFATGVADRLTNEVLSLQELVERLNPANMEEFFHGLMEDRLPEIVAEAAEILKPGLWASLAPEAQQSIIATIEQQTFSTAGDLFEDLKEDAENIIDIRELIIELLTGDNVDRLVSITRDTAQKELKFIEYYGGVFGFVIGIVQVLAYNLLNEWWIMPIIGVLVGLVTNYLAIQMIFRPLEPKKFFGVVEYQGMFPKRQPAIAADYGRVCEDELLTPQNIITHITEGPKGTELAQRVLGQVNEQIDEHVKALDPMFQLDVDEAKLNQLKAFLVLKTMEDAPDMQPGIEAYMVERLQIAATIEERLGALPKPEFERLVRGIFEEDELILILVGGVLGGMVGLGQAAAIVTFNID